MAEYRPGAVLEDLSFPKERAPDLTNMQAPDGDLPGIVPLRDLLTPAVLAGASLSDLLEARGLIEARLPPASLKDVDLERELVLQTMALKELQARVLGDFSVPANQKAQVASATGASLISLTKLKGELMGSTRRKLQESVLMDVINTLPKEQAQQFLSGYAEALAEAFPHAGREDDLYGGDE